MAWLFGDSCDGYATADLPLKYLGFVGPNVTVDAGQGSGGSNALRVNGPLAAQLITSSTTLISGRRMRLDVLGSMVFHMVWDGIDSVGNVAYCILADGSLQAWRITFNNNMLQIVAGNDELLGTTAPGIIRGGIYNHIQTKTTVHASAGYVGIVVNGVTVLDVSGVNTLNDMTFGGRTPVARYSMGINGHELGPGSLHTSSYAHIDDIWFCDDIGGSPGDGCTDYLGDLVGEFRVANGAGASADWTPSAGTNHSCVDDATPDGDSTYVASDTPNDVDMYTHSALLRVTSGVKAVQVAVVARKSGAGTRAVAIGTTPTVSDVYGPDLYLSEGYTMYLQSWGLNPDTGLPWTVAEANAAQIGQKVTV